MLKPARFAREKYVAIIAVVVLWLLLVGCRRAVAKSILTCTGSSSIDTSGRRATAPRLSPECPEDRTSGMWARRPAAFSRAGTAGSTGIPSSTRSGGVHLVRWRGGERSEHIVGGNRRIVHPQPQSPWDKDLQTMDAGKTWSLMGLEKAARIGRVENRPRNPDVGWRARWATPTAAARSARLPHRRRRKDLGKKCSASTRTRLLLTWASIQQPANPFCRDVADREIHTGGAPGRAGQRLVQVDQTVRHMEAPGGSWSAAFLWAELLFAWAKKDPVVCTPR